MQFSISLSLSSPSTICRSDSSSPAAASNGNVNLLNPRSLRFCGLRREAFGLNSSISMRRIESSSVTRRPCSNRILASLSGNGAPSKEFDYDLVIIGAGVGGHGAALHAVEKGLKTAIIEGDVVGGTCVNRGCVPSKALLAVSGRMRELQNEHHMKSFGLQVAAAGYDRQAVADHANNLASKIRSNLTNSMKSLGVDILTGFGSILGPQKVKYGDTVITAKDIIIATGSVPMVPKGIEVDGKTVITSDHALKLEFIPQWIAIVGSGYIGLEFSDVYTALGSEVTFVEALDQLMPGFDPEIGKLAQRVLINPRKIDYHTGVFASKITPAKDGKPVTIELIDAKTKELKDTLEVDAALIATGRAPFTQGLGLENINVQTQRGFVPVDSRMRVIDASGELVPHLYCIGDANGKMMLAHAASAQGISVVEQVTGKDHVLNHLSIPAACFTHPEISMVGLTENIDVCFYYLRKKSKYGPHSSYKNEPNKSYKYSTVDCNFMNVIRLLNDVYSMDAQNLKDGGQEHHLMEYINGFRMHAAVPWHTIEDIFILINIKEKHHWVLAVLSFSERCIFLYDSYESSGHYAAVLAEIEKISKIISLCLQACDFYVKKGIDHQSHSRYKDKQSSDMFDVLF